MLCSHPTTSCNTQCCHLLTTLHTMQISWYIPWLEKLYPVIKSWCTIPRLQKLVKLHLEKTMGGWHKATTRWAKKEQMLCLSWNMKRYNKCYELVKNHLCQPSGRPLTAKGGHKLDSNHSGGQFDQLQWGVVGPQGRPCHSKIHWNSVVSTALAKYMCTDYFF